MLGVCRSVGSEFGVVVMGRWSSATPDGDVDLIECEGRPGHAESFTLFENSAGSRSRDARSAMSFWIVASSTPLLSCVLDCELGNVATMVATGANLLTLFSTVDVFTAELDW